MFDRLCWGSWSIARPKLVRCDAHWHRPKRADWRAKAYERAANRSCSASRIDALACTEPVVHEAWRLAFMGVCRG